MRPLGLVTGNPTCECWASHHAGKRDKVTPAHTQDRLGIDRTCKVERCGSRPDVLENPWSGFGLRLPACKQLLSHPEVPKVRFCHCCFDTMYKSRRLWLQIGPHSKSWICKLLKGLRGYRGRTTRLETSMDPLCGRRFGYVGGPSNGWRPVLDSG